MSQRINRRAFLKTSAVAGGLSLTGMAGCIGDDEGPETLMIVGFPEEGAQVLRDYYADFEGEADIIVPDGLQDPELPDLVGQSLEGIIGTVPAPAGPQVQAFSELYQDAYDRSPGVFNAHTFDAVALLILANAAAGENSGPAIQQQMRRIANPEGEEVGPEDLQTAVQLAAEGADIQYSGASSACNFDVEGDMTAVSFDIWEYVDDPDNPISVLETLDFDAVYGGDAADEGPGGFNREMRVAMLLPASGDLAPVGGPMIDAGNLAADIVQDMDNIDLDFGFQDTQTDTDATLSAGGSLVDAGYPAICGAAASDGSIPLATTVLAPNQVVGCSPSSTAPAITLLDDEDFFFRTAPSDALQGGVMAQVTAEDLGNETASTLYRDDDYGDQLQERYAEAFEDDWDGEVFHQVPYDPEDASFFSPLDSALSPP